MKTLIISAIAALIFHAVLFTFNPHWQKPRLQSHKARSVTVSLSYIAPRPVRSPLPVAHPDPISPLELLALKKPIPKPEPVVKAVAKKVIPKPEKVPEVPLPDPPPPPVFAAEEARAAEPETAQAMSSTAGADDVPPPDPDSQNPDQAETIEKDPSPVYNPKPVYPRVAQRRQYQGTVVVQALVDIHGRVARVDLLQSSGHHILDRAAREGVLKWRFEPATRGGMPVDKIVEVPVVFRIE